jgi:hypothetical protein
MKAQIRHEFEISASGESATCARCGVVVRVCLENGFGMRQLGTFVYVVNSKGRRVVPSAVKCKRPSTSTTATRL